VEEPEGRAGFFGQLVQRPKEVLFQASDYEDAFEWILSIKEAIAEAKGW